MGKKRLIALTALLAFTILPPVPITGAQSLKESPDRFMMGTDQFLTPLFSELRRKPGRGKPAKAFFAQLPSDLAYKIGIENPRKVFNLKP